MAYVISLEGCHGVGKTALIEALRQGLPDVDIHDETFHLTLRNEWQRRGFSMVNQEDFYEVQAWYVKYEVERWATLRQKGTAIIARGPEQKEFYFLHYPRTIGADWDSEELFRAQMHQLRSCRSNRILFLHARRDTILTRIELSGRPRRNLQHWLRLWEPYYESYMLANPKTRRLDTDEMSASEVADWTVHWIREGCPLSSLER